MCCQSSCKLAAAGVKCRPQYGECDVDEVCTGLNPECPSDMGAPPTQDCTTTDGEASNCYAGSCLTGLNKQCTTFNDGVAQLNCDAQPQIFAQMPSTCTALTCSPVAEAPSWNCLQVSDKKQVTTVEETAEGTTTRLQDIWLSGAVDGSPLCGGDKSRCRGNVCVNDVEVCSPGSFLETGRAECVPCSTGCAACTGPSLYECTACTFGSISGGDAPGFGRCPTSAEQCALVAGCVGTGVVDGDGISRAAGAQDLTYTAQHFAVVAGSLLLVIITF